MDYSIFRFEAVVDFIEVEIHTATRANGGKIHNNCSLGSSIVEPIDAGAGNYATAFKIKVHDLRRFADLKAAVARIESSYPLSRPPVVTMIEVAFDGYLKDGQNGTADDLAMLAARMAWFVSNPADLKNIRYYNDLGADYDPPLSVESLAQKMLNGVQYGSGNVENKRARTKQDDRSHHGYLKTTDSCTQLPPDQHRARLEIRLAGAALPHADIEGWQGFRFESLASYLNWRKVHDIGTTTPLQQLLMKRPGASHRKDFKRHEGTVGGKGGGTRGRLLRADPLSRVAEKRLQNLTRSWQRGEK